MLIFCDTHVHCYEFDKMSALLDSALVNFKKAGVNGKNILFFTDGKVDRTWDKLRPLVDESQQLGSWILQYSEG